MISTAKKLYELASEYLEYSEELLACDPSVSEDALLEFISIQQWGEDLNKKATQKGFSWEQVEDHAAEIEMGSNVAA